MACGYPSFLFSYFFLILVLHTSLTGQNQFGRIFKENANPLFKEEIKQDTVVKQNIVSEELFIQIDNIDTVAAGTEKAQYQRKHNIDPGSPEWFTLWFSRPKLTGENPMPKKS